MTLVYPQKVTLYQVGDLVEGASFNNFLDAIDGSYCTYEGGDDPIQDAAYPDPYGGYQGPENCGGYAATKVISTSYGYNEADLTPQYEQRQCHEYMKLGLMGVSVLYSSGDYGVAGNGGQCINETITPGNSTYTNGDSGKFNPSFPSTCPYVTSVGATQVITYQATAKREQPASPYHFRSFSNPTSRSKTTQTSPKPSPLAHNPKKPAKQSFTLAEALATSSPSLTTNPQLYTAGSQITRHHTAPTASTTHSALAPSPTCR
jgi:tripeptidyl-peptidase-1